MHKHSWFMRLDLSALSPIPLYFYQWLLDFGPKVSFLDFGPEVSFLPTFIKAKFNLFDSTFCNSKQFINHHFAPMETFFQFIIFF